jgi:hypothetical protein
MAELNLQDFKKSQAALDLVTAWAGASEEQARACKCDRGFMQVRRAWHSNMMNHVIWFCIAL